MVYSIASPTFQPVRNIQNLKSEANAIQEKISTGRKANSFPELGADREFVISLDATIARLESYNDNALTVKTSLSIIQSSVDTIAKVFTDAKSEAQGSTLGDQDKPHTVAQKSAEGALGIVISALNVDYAGRHLFAGQETNKKPVEALKAVIDGENGRDGYADYLEDRWQADQGAAGLGRLSITQASDKVTLAEDGAGHPFGFKIDSVVSDFTQAAVSGPTGATKDLVFDFSGGVPEAGEVITLLLTLPDGQSTSLELKAVSGDAADGEFKIDASTATTATNFETALTDSLKKAVTTELKGSSAIEAANNFFFSAAEGAPSRVDNSGTGDAVALVKGTVTDSVFWYRGDSSSDDPRDRVHARVSEYSQADYGFQANEEGFLRGIRALASFSQVEFDPAVKGDAEAYRNLGGGVADLLAEAADSDGLRKIEIDLVSASVVVGRAEAQNDDALQLSKSLLAEIQDVDLTEAAVLFQDVLTQLEATYRTITALRSFNLVNYL